MATGTTDYRPLRALRTQVGGHHMLFEIDREWVCKPLNARERLFYESLPTELKPFTPKHRGTITVEFAHSVYTRGGPILAATKSASDSGCDHARSFIDRSQVANCLTSMSFGSLKNMPSTNAVATLSPYDFDRDKNPWTEFRMEQLKTSLMGNVSASIEHEHIVIENLTSKFKYPCVMDLKMGTRSYSDFMDNKSKAKHIHRSATTTSGSLGIRLGGMQLYKPMEEKYHLMNKFYGHSLDESGLREVLRTFLCNGTQFRTNLIPILVQKLKRLREIIRHLDSYRLFSSSLLIMYEGAVTASDEHHLTDFHMTDSGHISSEVITPSPVPTLLSVGSMKKSHQVYAYDNGKEDLQLIDVRMIDFSSVTSKHYVSDPIRYEGPDEGYIKGLTTIIDIFEE